MQEISIIWSEKQKYFNFVIALWYFKGIGNKGNIVVPTATLNIANK